jgi:hypothetical protein
MKSRQGRWGIIDLQRPESEKDMVLLPLPLGEGWGEGAKLSDRKGNLFSFRYYALTLALSQRERELEQLLFVGLFRLDDADLVHRILQHGGFDVPERRNLAGRFVGRFLNHVADVALRPLPLNLMTLGGFIQTLPPIVVCFAAKAAAHRLNNVFRIRVQTHAARFLQSFQTKRGRRDLCLLIGGFAEVSSKRAPKTFEAEQRNCRRARRVAAIAEARAVTKDRHEFRWSSIALRFHPARAYHGLNGFWQ